jgi:hypothetical protein
MEAMCDTLEAKDQETCKQIVDGFMAQIIKFIAQVLVQMEFVKCLASVEFLLNPNHQFKLNWLI